MPAGVDFDNTTAELMKGHLLQHFQESQSDVSFSRQMARLAFINGTINPQEALGFRVATESGSGIARDLGIKA
jgi:hypothetical protein